MGTHVLGHRPAGDPAGEHPAPQPGRRSPARSARRCYRTFRSGSAAQRKSCAGPGRMQNWRADLRWWSGRSCARSPRRINRPSRTRRACAGRHGYAATRRSHRMPGDALGSARRPGGLEPMGRCVAGRPAPHSSSRPVCPNPLGRPRTSTRDPQSLSRAPLRRRQDRVKGPPLGSVPPAAK